MRPLLLFASLAGSAVADVYLNNPRGSNNKLSEQSNNVQNANRLFDSQNNAAGGYQIGDDCRPVCQDQGRNYDATKPGAMQGVMTLYQGSELYIEWFMQHGCGSGHPNLRCQMILQYMSDADNSNIRDGTLRGGQNTAGGNKEPPTKEAGQDPTLGQHEPVEYYQACKARERNKGLYAADQEVRDDRGATATRQNPNGNSNANDRHGLECPEERDYFPYWHPTPWHDIAVLTDEPQIMCAYYRNMSQNVKARGLCSEPAINNPKACKQAGGTWKEEGAFGEPPPDCAGGIQSRDNHNGNVRNGRPMYYVWRIPDYVRGRVVLRLRYNITTMDFEPGAIINQAGPASEQREIQNSFFIDESYNDRDPSQRRRAIFRGGPPILANDPQADWLNLGDDERSRILQLQVNTNQVARTFEDRTHTFTVRERPSSIPDSMRVVNYNVRGRRGNIVQVYPSVEYDFVPPDLVVEEGSFLHFQWAGSDANAKANAGNGRQGTDRSNLVQVSARGENVPLPIEKHTLFFAAQSDPDDVEGRALVDSFAYLNQDSMVSCDADGNDEQATENCKQLNGASAYFDGGLVEMKQPGTHHIASTRNNDFSNRSQKASITVTPRPMRWYFLLAIVLGPALVIFMVLYLGAAIYALKRPSSWLFSKRYRPRVLRWCVSQQTLRQKLEIRKTHQADKRKCQAAVLKSSADVAGGAMEVSGTKHKMGFMGRCRKRLRHCGVHEQRLAMTLYVISNVAVFFVGFLSNLDGGFQRSIAYPIAKGAGYTLDLNFAFVVLPTLKSLQTAFRSAGATREWVPIDDPISFHVAIAGLIMFGTVAHVWAHIEHMRLMAAAPALQQDPLSLWSLTAEEQLSGTPMWSQAWDFSHLCAPFSGGILVALMAVMLITSIPCARRGTNSCARRLGGYNLFWRAHLCWRWVYVVLLLHAPGRVWIWLLFPTLFVVADRMLLTSRPRAYVALRQAKLLPRDVISLIFDVPPGFTYQAGQYILLGWRGEWHPFTLTSAPEERRLSVHIRAPDTLDWCSALRRRLLVEAPEAASHKESAVATSTCDLSEMARVSSVDYVAKPCMGSQVIYCQPAPSGVEPAGTATNRSCASSNRAPAEPVATQDIEGGTSHESLGLVPEALPADAVVLQLSGPFGAPAQKVWQYETIMAVGAGIGVTPFASILRSVQIRAKQREAVQGLVSRSRPGNSTSAFEGIHQLFRDVAPRPQDEDTLEGIQHLLRDVIKVPKRIYFYWIVRSQEELEWFYDLLAAAMDGPARDNVHVSVFMTGEVELKQVRELSCVQSQFFGRPNWGRIFKQNKQEHKGEHIGVFLCGSPAIGKELSVQSAKHTDPPGVPTATRFSFFKEHF